MFKYFLSTALIFILLSATVFAQTKTWVGPALGGNWNTAGNWSPSGVPASTDNVIIENQSAFTIIQVTSGSFECNNLNLVSNDDGNNTWLIINSNATLIVNGNMVFQTNLSTFSGDENAVKFGNSGTNRLTIHGSLSTDDFLGATINQINIGTGSNSTLELRGTVSPSGIELIVNSNSTNPTLIINSASIPSLDLAAFNLFLIRKIIVENNALSLQGLNAIALEEHSFTVNSGASIDFNNANIEMSGDLINNGSGFSNFNSLSFVGTTNSTLSGNNTFSDVTVNKTAAALNITTGAGNTQSITGNFLISDGTVNTNGNLLLISDGTNLGKIGPISGTLNGDVTVQRRINTPAGWKFFGSPVTGGEYASWSNSFNVTTNAGATVGAIETGWQSFYTWSGAAADPTFDTGYVAVPNITAGQQIPNGVGHFAWIQADNASAMPKTLAVSGTVANGTATLSALGNGTRFSGFNLFANPHPCPVNVNSLNLTGLALNDLYVFESSTGNFVQCKISAGGILASGEGFVCQAGASDFDIEFTQAAKSAASADNFNKSANKHNDIYMRIELNEGNHSDLATFQFIEGASTGKDPFTDSPKLDNAYGRSNIASLAGDEKLLNNALPAEGNYTLPLVIYKNAPSNQMRNFSVAFSNMEYILSSNKCIVLVDSVSGFSMPISKDTSYAFSMIDSITSPRLYLHFSSPLSGDQKEVTCKNGDDGEIYVSGSGNGPFNYIYTNMANDVVATHLNKFGADTLQNLRAGMYTVSITGNQGNCPQMGKKFDIIEPMESPLASFELTTDTLFTGEVLQVSNTSTFANTFHWNMGDGNSYSNTAEPMHSYNFQGLYQIELEATADGNCGNTKSKQVLVKAAPSAIESIESEKNVSIFMASDKIQIQFLNFENEQLQMSIKNLLGQQVFQTQIYGESGKQLTFDKPGTGVYLVSLKGESSNIVQKLIIP